MAEEQTTQFYFIRHAESEFNRKHMEEVNAQGHGLEKEHLIEEADHVKWNSELFDCSISELGKQQAKEANSEAKKLDISLVVVSPLRRALQTAQIIFEGHPSNPKILVQPLMREALCSSCDVPANISDLKQEFEGFDWSLLSEAQGTWYLSHIDNPEVAELDQDMEKQGLTYAQRQLKILEFIKARVSPDCETPTWRSRLDKAKANFRELAQSNKLAAVGHSNFFRNYTKFYTTQSFHPKNCEIIQLDC